MSGKLHDKVDQRRRQQHDRYHTQANAQHTLAPRGGQFTTMQDEGVLRTGIS